MEKALENITETIKENGKDLTEIIKERVFSPMYFYFIIAWIITNWKFVYSMIFLDQTFLYEKKSFLKVEYLESFYSFSGWGILISLLQLIIIPAVSAWFVVWILSQFAEKFYKKHEEHKINKRKIKKLLEYGEKVEYQNEQRTIRQSLSDKNQVRYEDNSEFNAYFDELNDPVKIGDTEYLASESLYNNDIEAYKENLNSWNTENNML